MRCLKLVSLLYALYFTKVKGSAEHLAYILEIQNPNCFLVEHPEAHLRHIFDSNVLRGLSVQFDSLEHANLAMQDPNIIRSWPVTHQARPMSTTFTRQVPVSIDMHL